MLQAYNDWAIDEWCGEYPGRFIPLGIVPMWDVDAAVAEVRRIAKKGCRSISFLETPHVQGFPSFLSGYWDPMLGRAERGEHGALAAHRRRLQRHPEAGGGAGRPPDGAGLPDQRHHGPGPAVRARRCGASPTSRSPSPRAASAGSPSTSTGSTGTSRTRSGCTATSAASCPSEVFRDHILACYITDPSGLLLRDRIGIDVIAWECDYPHTDTTWPQSPEFAWKEFQDAGCRDDEIHKITWENACRFYGWDPFAHTAREAGDGAARCGRPRPTSTSPACPRTSGASATRPPASAS